MQRVLKSKPLPRVNTLVDVGNWCSLDFLLPIGVYDADRISGQVVFKKGGAADRYAAINQREINFEGRYVLADDHGAFGSPMTDSLRTAVQPDTVRTFLVMYAPADYPRDTFRRQSETLAERVVDICGGRVVSLDIIAG